MKAAGATALGRTNLPELGLSFSTDNPLRGRTLNPWNPTPDARWLERWRRGRARDRDVAVRSRQRYRRFTPQPGLLLRGRGAQVDRRPDTVVRVHSGRRAGHGIPDDVSKARWRGRLRICGSPCGCSPAGIRGSGLGTCAVRGPAVRRKPRSSRGSRVRPAGIHGCRDPQAGDILAAAAREVEAAVPPEFALVTEIWATCSTPTCSRHCRC